MTLVQAMAELKALGDEKMRAVYAKHGVGDDHYGVKMGDVRAIAKKIKTNPELAGDLWETGNLDARFLATLLMKPKQLSADEVDRMVRSVVYSPTADYSHLSDWLMTNVIRPHPQKEELRTKWMADAHPMAARAGWSLTAERVAKDPDGLDLSAILDRIEHEMKDAPSPVQWTMNACLAAIGIHHPAHRSRALATGEALGVYRDFPTPKGCTSPFAPIWINEIVSRQG